MLFLISDYVPLNRAAQTAGIASNDDESASFYLKGVMDSPSGHVFHSHSSNQTNEGQLNRAITFTSQSLIGRLPDVLHCRICGEAIPTLVLLSQHMYRCHGQEERYVCPVCGNIYQTVTGLRHHTQIHEGKVFPCKLCGAKFTRKGTMVRHLRGIHNVSYYNLTESCKM